MKKGLVKYCYLFVLLSFGFVENVFSQADAGRDTSICKGSKVKIGPKKSDISWCYTWSPDNGTLNDKKIPNPEANPIITTTYTLTVVGPNFSFTHTGSMIVKVKEPRVKFVEYPNQKFGFDDYGLNITSPWKSVKVGDNDKVTAKTTPSTDFDIVKFKSTSKANVTVSPNKASSDSQELTFAGVSKGTSEMQANCSKEDGDNISKMNVAVYNERSKTVALILIIEENDDIQEIPLGQGKPNQIAITAGVDKIVSSVPKGDDITSKDGSILTGPNGICETTKTSDDIQVISLGKGKPNEVCVSKGANSFRDTKLPIGDDAIIGNDITTGPDGISNTVANSTNVSSTDVNDNDIRDYLKEVYKQAIVKWTVVRLTSCTCNYDLDRNDIIDVNSWMSNEMRVIRDKCGNSSYDHNIFYVNKPSDNSTGFMSYNQRYGFVHADKSSIPAQTTSHELGHGAFGLVHTPADNQNVMYNYLGNYRQLRKNQWDIVNP